MNNKPNIEKFGRVSIDRDAMAKLFRERREQLGISIRELAAQAGVGATTVHTMEQGKTGANLETFLRVLAALDLLPEHVLQVDEKISELKVSRVESEILEILKNCELEDALIRIGELFKTLKK